MSVMVLCPEELALIAIGLLEGSRVRAGDVLPIFERVARASAVNARAWATAYPSSPAQGPFTASEIARALLEHAMAGRGADLRACHAAAASLEYNTSDVATDEERSDIEAIERAVLDAWTASLRPALRRRKRDRLSSGRA